MSDLLDELQALKRRVAALETQSNPGRNPYLDTITTPTNTLNISSTGANQATAVEIGGNATGNRYSFIDLHGDDTYTDFSLRIIRGNSGANAESQIVHQGTGTLYNVNLAGGNSDWQYSGGTRWGYRNLGLYPGFYPDLGGNGGPDNIAWGLRLGAEGSGEGINSNRTTGNNQYGLDFYGGSAVRGRMTGAGLWALATNAVPTISVAIGQANTGLNYESASVLSLRTGGTNSVRFTANGIFIGNAATTPTYTLQLVADSAGKPSTGTWTIISDPKTKAKVERRKRKRGEAAKRLAKLPELITYRYNGQYGTPSADEQVKDSVGFDAAEIKQARPDMYHPTWFEHRNEDGVLLDAEELGAWNPHHLMLDTYEATRDQQEEIDDLKRLVAEQGKLIAQLTASLKNNQQ